MVDAKRYLRLKDKGLVKILQEDGAMFLTFKRFNVEDGTEIIEQPEKQFIDLEEIKKRKEDITKELQGIEELLKELGS